MKTHNTKAHKGFALIEVMLVVAMIGVISGTAIPMYRQYQVRTDLSNGSSLITQGIARAQSLAEAGAEDSEWGFSIEHGTLFKGTTYIERDPAFDEYFPVPTGIVPTGTSEVWFEKITGTPNAPGSMVTLTGNDGQIQTIDLELDPAGTLVSRVDLIAVCHNPSGPSPETMFLQDPAISVHLAHGDINGTCPVVSSTSSAASAASSVASTASSAAASSAAAAASSVSSSRSSAASSSSSSAQAVAITTKGIYLLHSSSQGTLNMSGNAHLTVGSNGSLKVNSTHAASVYLTNNAILTFPTMQVRGTPGYSIPSGNAHMYGTVTSGVGVIADPLASLAVPTPAQNQLSAVTVSSNATVTLNPNTYKGISVSGNGKLTLNPGTYYVNGNFSVSGNGWVTGSGVTIYATNGTVNLSGNGKITLSPPSSGTYAGVTLFQNRTSTNTISMAGNGILTIKGALYAAAAQFSITGNGSSNVVGSLLIGKSIVMSGNGIVNVQ